MASFNYSLPTVRQGVNAGGRRLGVTNLVIPREEITDWVQEMTLQVFREELRFEQSRGNLSDPIIETDYKVGKPARKVRAFGRIAAYDRVDIAEVIDFIFEMLHRESPYKTGRYFKSHVVMVNGVQYDFDSKRLPGLTEKDSVEFVNVQPYAKRIEQGWSPMAPRGVYKRVMKAAARKYGKSIYLKFTYRTLNLGRMVTRYIGGDKRPLRRPQRVDAIYPVIVLRFLSSKTNAMRAH